MNVKRDRRLPCREAEIAQKRYEDAEADADKQFKLRTVAEHRSAELEAERDEYHDAMRAAGERLRELAGFENKLTDAEFSELVAKSALAWRSRCGTCAKQIKPSSRCREHVGGHAAGNICPDESFCHFTPSRWAKREGGAV